jgi:hypothetical protein
MLATSPALPLHEAGKYVAGAYVVLFAIVRIYVAIMAVRLSRIERELGGLLELADRDRQPPRSGDEPGDGASAADARAQAGAQDADAGGVQGAARAESTLA